MKTYTPETQDDWLAFRRARLTATEVAGLHLNRTVRHWQNLRDEKDTGIKAMTGNQYTAWGHAREPEIAAIAQGLDSRLLYNDNPQVIVINPDDDRLCGTPDLFDAGGEVIGECKTSKHEFIGGKFHPWCPDQYYLQCQANLWHTGAEACILVVEYYQEDDGRFVPYRCERRVIIPNQEVIDALAATAREWFAWVEQDTRPGWMGEDLGLDGLDELTGLVESLARADEHAKHYKAIADKAKADIIALTGGAHASTVAGYKLSVSQVAESTTFDTTRFKKDHPDLVAQYQKKKAAYTTVRLTKGKD
ncbi:YqaJ viral recombinase family protein [Corynebacterium lizhenjunii]|uniref:YqaJ viral recombinase family protein n=1 Tax=Corynebacterium lizhenjunii TaxID=2709394 RepID=UPI0013ED7F2E|nr:YqaJ viral recombinase family protein [Corynebacterium lizhenjunii]